MSTNTTEIADLRSNSGAPIGSIVAYDGSDTIPDSWALCDGTNGTPDLRGRFLVGQDPNQTEFGSNDMRTKGRFGGQLKYIHTHGADVKSTVLTANQIPQHKHEFTGDDRLANASSYFRIIQSRVWDTDSSGSDSGNGGPKILTNKMYDNSNRIVNGGAGHDHGISVFSDTEYIAPPYYVVVWIKRIA